MTIHDTFENLSGGAFIPYITAGYPDVETSIRTGMVCAESGADILELGIPFSDPLADGPVIQESFQKSLDAGITLDDCFRVASEIKKSTAIPIILMISYNLVFHKGVEAFAQCCKENSVDGVIIPDLPPEVAGDDHAVFSSYGIDMIFLIAPNTPLERREKIFAYSSGYLYCISRLGITGVREDIADGLAEYLSPIRDHTSLPLCVGFGISKPEHVRKVCKFADGVIVGSAIVKMITEYSNDKKKMLGLIGEYVQSMKAAAKGMV